MMIAVLFVVFFVVKLDGLLLSDLQEGNTILIKNYYGGYFYNKISDDSVIQTSNDLSLSDANFFWKIIKQNSYYQFENEATGKYIKGHDSGIIYASDISTGGSWLSWYSGTISNGIQKLKRQSGGKCWKSDQIIDTTVSIGSCSGDDKYFFSFEYKPLYLSNLKDLDIVVISNADEYSFYSDNTDPTKIITTDNYNINDGHLWYIEQVSSTYYRFKNKLTGYYIKGVQDEVDLVGYNFDGVDFTTWNQQKRIQWYQGSIDGTLLYKTKIKRRYKGHCWQVSSVNDPIELESSCNAYNSFYFSFGLYYRPLTNPPTQNPTVKPTLNPSKYPTKHPTKYPTVSPTQNPSRYPTLSPSKNPTIFPTLSPTKNPTKYPTLSPTKSPTIFPTKTPTIPPTSIPTVTPTYAPTSPTKNPTFNLNNCQTDYGCQGQQIFCVDNQDCEIICQGTQACEFATVHCPNNGKCIFKCIGFKACYGTTFIAGTIGSDMIFDETSGFYASDGIAAEVATIDARNADSLLFDGVCWSRMSSCKHIKIYCPLSSSVDNEKCTLFRCNYDMRYATFYVPNDLSDINWIRHSCGPDPFTESQGLAVYCNYDGADYNSSCDGIYSTFDENTLQLLCDNPSICNAANAP